MEEPLWKIVKSRVRRADPRRLAAFFTCHCARRDELSATHVGMLAKAKESQRVDSYEVLRASWLSIGSLLTGGRRFSGGESHQEPLLQLFFSVFQWLGASWSSDTVAFMLGTTSGAFTVPWSSFPDPLAHEKRL